MQTTRDLGLRETGQFPRRSGSLLELVPNVACLQLPIVNLYLVGERGAGDRRWVLIDAGLRFFAGSIRQAAAKRFGPRSRPAAVVLTHGHFDHVGTLPELAEAWEAPVYAHDLEMPYLTGQSSYPPPDPAVGGGTMSFLSRLYPRGPIDLGSRVRLLPTDGTVPGMPGWRWVHTPGHAPGHVSFFRETDRTLIAGDAFVTVKQESALDAYLQYDPRVRRPPAYYTADWAAARQSVRELADLRPEVAATGHGPPLYGKVMRRELEDLAENWERDAVPSHGRYVCRPAVTDEFGVRSVPPPVRDPQLWGLVGAAAAGLGIYLLNRQSPRASGTRNRSVIG